MYLHVFVHISGFVCFIFSGVVPRVKEAYSKHKSKQHLPNDISKETVSGVLLLWCGRNKGDDIGLHVAWSFMIDLPTLKIN